MHIVVISTKIAVLNMDCYIGVHSRFGKRLHYGRRYPDHIVIFRVGRILDWSSHGAPTTTRAGKPTLRVRRARATLFRAEQDLRL